MIEKVNVEQFQTPAKREIVLNLLLDACIRLDQVERAVFYVEDIIFKKKQSLARPDEVTFNTLLKGCAQHKLLNKSFDLFELMMN